MHDTELISEIDVLGTAALQVGPDGPKLLFAAGTRAIALRSAPPAIPLLVVMDGRTDTSLDAGGRGSGERNRHDTADEGPAHGRGGAGGRCLGSRRVLCPGSATDMGRGQ